MSGLMICTHIFVADECLVSSNLCTLGAGFVLSSWVLASLTFLLGRWDAFSL